MDVEGLMDDMVSGSLSVTGPKLRKIGGNSIHPGTNLYFGAVQAIFRREARESSPEPPRDKNSLNSSSVY